MQWTLSYGAYSPTGEEENGRLTAPHVGKGPARSTIPYGAYRPGRLAPQYCAHVGQGPARSTVPYGAYSRTG